MKLTNSVYFYPERGMLDCNTYLIKGDIIILIDPGLEQYLPELISEMRWDGLETQDIDFIVNTHLHPDHCQADEALKQNSKAKILFHPLQRQFYQDVAVKTSRFLGLDPVEVKASENLPERLDAGKIELEILRAPGHSPDSLCFYCRNERIMICGDSVFNEGIGRADLPGGNAAELKKSIERISKLDIEYLLPGHMDIVRGKENVKRNLAFIQEHILP